MAFKIIGCDNIRESFSAANSTTISLGGAVPNSNAIGSKLANGDTSWFAVRNGAEFSEGEFTYNTGTPNTLTQTTVKKSSNGNAAVTFSSGNGEAYIDLPTYIADLLNLVEITVASATTCDIGAVDGAKIVISGTTTITGLGTSINKLRFVRFSGALTLTHNGTSLILPGAANIVTVAGDTAVFDSDSSGNWRCRSYNRGTLIPIDGAAGTAYTPTITATTGTFTTVSASGTWKQIGRYVFWRLLITVSTLGSAAGRITVPLPTGNVVGTAGFAAVCGGWRNDKKQVQGNVVGSTTSVDVILYDATFPVAGADNLTLQGWYELS